MLLQMVFPNFVLQMWLHGKTIKILETRRYVVICALCACLRALVVLTWWQVVGELLAEGGWDAGRLLHEAQSAEVKAKLHSTTSQ